MTARKPAEKPAAETSTSKGAKTQVICGMTTELLDAEIEKAQAVLPESVVRFIEECNTKPHSNSYLIPVLHMVQDETGYLSKEAMDAVSTLMQIPATKVTGVASFYHFFNFNPPGQHRISLCMGTACFVKGSGAVLDKLKELLGAEVGETTADTLFTIDVARCVGACALAPVMIVDDKVYAEVTPDKLPKILAEYGFDNGKKGKTGAAAPLKVRAVAAAPKAEAKAEAPVKPKPPAEPAAKARPARRKTVPKPKQ